MPKFRYRMQNILNIKEKLEEQAKNEFAQAQMIVNEAEEKLNQLFDRKGEYEDEGKRLLAKNLDVKKINENRQAVETIEEYIKDQQRVLDRANKELEKKREALTEAQKERKMHEKLKEKALDSYLMEEKAAEAKSIDELTSYTYGNS